MKILAIIKGVCMRVIRMDWVYGPKGCEPFPVLVVEDSRVFVLGRSLHVVKK